MSVTIPISADTIYVDYLISLDSRATQLQED